MKHFDKVYNIYKTLINGINTRLKEKQNEDWFYWRRSNGKVDGPKSN